MAKYRITAPDGGTYEITAPDDASESDVLSYAQQQFASSSAPTHSDFSGVQGGTSTAKMIGPGGWLNERGTLMYPDGATIDQVNQINQSYQGSPYAQDAQRRVDASQAQAQKDRFQSLPGIAQAALGAGSSVERMAYGLGQRLGLTSDSAEAERRQRFAQQHGSAAATIGQIGGDAAMMALPMTRLGGAGALGSYGTAAATGAAAGALQPVLGNESVALNAAMGGALGLAGQGLSSGIAAVGKRAANAVSPELRKLYEQAKAIGVQLTPAQLSDSQFVKRLTLMLDRMPLSGATARQQAQLDAINTQAAKTIGQNSDRVDQSVMSEAYDTMTREYDNLFSGGMQFDRKFLRDLADVRKEATEQLGDTANKVVNSIIDRVRTQGKGGELKGRALQSIDRMARNAQESGDPDRVGIGAQIRDAIRENIERTAGPATRKQVQDLNRRYASYKTLEPLVARNPEGGISPTQLLGAVNATKRGRARMARGEAGDLGQLALIGQRLKQPTSSGTAENLQAGALGGGLLTAPLRTLGLLGAAPIASRALNSGLLSDYLMSSGRGQGAQALAPYLRPAGMPFIGLLSQEDPYDPRNRP